ncbi:aromatic-ring-hydroxylating dioxygenase subunit beta [Sphingomonas sp. 1P06PA]|uniref:aromatic-ring-hydroxylating dioxygenase subunit beta n=1 Tax=Sphingomonas sp. 1P06PA TaxID=554121 RepID=UPI0039A68856
MTTPINLLALDRLQGRYAHALDSQDMAGWLALFASEAEASYICITREHVRAGLPIALMMDDCRARLEDRVTYVTRIWAGTFQDYQTRHLTQRLSADRAADGTIHMVSNFVVYATAEENGVAEILTTGEYRDVICADADGHHFLSRTAVLDTSVLPRYIVYPI